MKKLIVLALSLIILSGCASFWKGIGVAAEETETAREAKLIKEIDTMKQALSELSQLSQEIAGLKAQAEEAKQAVAKAEEVKQALVAIQGRLDSLPNETLLKLSDILAKAVAQLPPVDGSTGK